MGGIDIGSVLKSIVTNLNDYLISKGVSNSNYRAEIRDIGKLSRTSSSGIKVTLINVEEDKVYKNHLLPLSTKIDSNTLKMNSLGGVLSMRISLYVLFSFNTQNTESEIGYLNTLSIMTHVLRYFKTQPYHELNDGNSTILEIEYHNISLEDSNNMWSNLGGEQQPYAMYRIKMLEVEQELPDELAPVLKQPSISNINLK